MLALTFALIGLGANPKESPTELAAWIDARLEANWRAKGLTTHEVAGDDVFLRRVYLELTGSIPSVSEARDFLESTSTNKRAELIRSLLEDKRFGEHVARQWARTLAPAGNTRGPLEGYLRAEIRKNTPFDQLARNLLTATGDANTPTAAAFYFAVGNTPERISESVGRGLLGVRLGLHGSATITRLRPGRRRISGAWQLSSTARTPVGVWSMASPPASHRWRTRRSTRRSFWMARRQSSAAGAPRVPCCRTGSRHRRTATSPRTS